MNINELFYNGQHGFRSSHSCETALHELLSDVNKNRDKRLITMLLFIDFRKAFDLVDSKTLLKKLFHYGLDNNALKLIANYFSNRSQAVKHNKRISTMEQINLGVPQGSVLGPLFFLIFINDLAFILDLNCKMFADDTTLYLSGSDLNSLIIKFKVFLDQMFEWCKFNKLDINWSKIFFMFITNKRIKNNIPKEIKIDKCTVKVVSSFKLLGVTIDDKLTFQQYSHDVRKMINRKLYSIKRLFYLCMSVKVQFFKTFVLPYFDYCLSLLVYFPKSTIQGLSNCFNCCLYKLFKIKLDYNVDNNITDEDINNFNKNLQIHGLFSFQHRLMNKLLSFLNFIITDKFAPINLKNEIVEHEIEDDSNTKTTRNGTYSSIVTEKFGQQTFGYFFSKLKSSLLSSHYEMTPVLFKNLINSSMSLNFPIFVKKFARFDVQYRSRNFKNLKTNKKRN